MSLEQKNEILEALSGCAGRVFELQSTLTAARALGPGNGGDGEQRKADYLETWLRSFGIDEIEHVDAADSRVSSGRRPNLIVRIPGRTARTLWILGHMDVVPAGEESLWHTDPWTVTRDEKDPDLIVGRGVEDNQQAIVCGCLIAAALKERNIVPDLGLGLIFVSDEETGNAYGIQHLFREKPDFIAEGDLVMVPDSGSADGRFIEVAEKGILWLRVVIEGRQCHASRPDEGNNALMAAAAMILGAAEVEKRFSARDGLFSPNRSTFTPTRHEANVPNVNTIPGREVFYIDCRVLPCYPLADVLAAFRELGAQVAESRGVRVEVEPFMQEPAAAPTPEDSPVVTSLKKAVKEVLGVDCRCGGIGGSTVAVNFRERGVPAAVWSLIFENCHAPNEAARISFAVKEAQVYASMLFNA
ncbi:M20 family metallo-hydrolase [Mailhella massiliensis]|uniref:M20 family metallo-hydrolase n=1 Tax=Mailhella massiliensis TaxID=1903261 RepID=A0A921DS17_9BACT|nr:M20 family metallo-hydrolase [Mailhella massiliensis]HJD98270.1 M20 family metallo-hydrolase [Mailhella massiliensis]